MSSTETPRPGPATVPALAATFATPQPEPCQWTSAALLGGGREALIEHVGSVYRLRLTASGKLILTK